MARETTSVSCIGDEEFVESLRMLAKKRHTKIGILVRQAIDQAHGAALKTVAEQSAIFFADSDAHVHQSNLESNDDGDS